jgi:hypothetical protein
MFMLCKFSMFVLCKLVKLVKSKWRGMKKRFLLLPASEIRGRIMQIHVKVGIDIVERGFAILS